METVSSYPVVLVVFNWKSVQISFCRHCLMESSIKYTYLRYIWHKLGAYTDTNQVSRIVKWCKVIALFYCFDHLICNDCRRSKFLAAMYDTMTNCINLCKTLDRTCFLIGKSFQNHLDCFFMSRHGSFCDLFVVSGFLIYQSSVNSDSLAKSLCKNCLCVRIDQLVF